jgi:hypothetical protein
MKKKETIVCLFFVGLPIFATAAVGLGVMVYNHGIWLSGHDYAVIGFSTGGADDPTLKMLWRFMAEAQVGQGIKASIIGPMVEHQDSGDLFNAGIIITTR